jgi:hypothetical protein
MAYLTNAGRSPWPTPSVSLQFQGVGLPFLVLSTRTRNTSWFLSNGDTTGAKVHADFVEWLGEDTLPGGSW